MYFMATSSLVSLLRMSLATPKFPDPISLTSSYFSIDPNPAPQINRISEKYGDNINIKKKVVKMNI
jgi:hypothetical protein